MRRSFLPLFLAAACGLLLLPAAASAQATSGSGSPNMELVKTIPYEAKVAGKSANYGTDIEFTKLAGKRHALAGSYYNGLRIVDISKPSRARTVSVYDCPIRQGDVQVFKAADGSKRTLATYTADASESAAIAKTGCFADAAALGFSARQPNGSGKQGTFIVDVTNPRAPQLVSFIEVPQGSHNMTVHPSGKYLYNSNSDLITSIAPAIEIIDITDPDAPKHAGELALGARPGLGTESHDITFNESGTRAYSAALSHEAIIDTTNPAKPTIISEFDDEAVNVWHQSDPVTLVGKDGKSRTYLIAEDEFAGAAGGPVCPSGGVHVYDITGAKERSPEKVGLWNITDTAGPTNNPEGTCTAHVFDIHEDEQLMTIAFYNGGVRVVDLAGLDDGKGIKAIGSYMTDNADSWSFKAPVVSRTGAFHAYGNDIARGLDVYRYDPDEGTSDPGVWLPGPALGEPGGTASATTKLSAAQLDVLGQQRSTSTSTGTDLSGYRMTCLLGSTP